MLLSKYVYIKWNSANRKHYVEMGYKFTKLGDEFKALVIDASKGCNSTVEVECDYCGEKTRKPLFNYIKDKNKRVHKDCCLNCSGKKAKDVVIDRYGVECTQLLNDVREKTIETFNNKYGCDNPMKNEGVKAKLRRSMNEKYGCEHALQNPKSMEKYKDTIMEKYSSEWYTQTEDYRIKSQETCICKYGVRYFLQTHKINKMRFGENNHNWKGGFKHHLDKRNTPEYRLWRSGVYEKDGYTCKCCGVLGKKLNAHHVLNYANNEGERFLVSNGETLCVDCHKMFHSIYGYLDTNRYQFEDFISTHGKNIV